MWLNQKTLDAIQIMSALAQHETHFMKAPDLAIATNITLMNVQKTANLLSQAGLIEASRGRSGGLRIAKPAHLTTIGEIVRAFEPKDCPINFLMMSEHEQEISKLMLKAHRGFFQPLEETTLAMLSNNSNQKSNPTRLKANFNQELRNANV